jgi:protein-disulfide isomerase
VAGGGEAAAAVTPAEAEAQQNAQFEQWYNAQLRVPLVVPAEGAKVLVVKFNDYQCPACAQSHKDYQGVLAKYEASQPGAVRLVMKDFPLESECNSNVSTTLHAAACEAAVAVRLAREKKLAGPLEEWLYSNQPAMTPQAVRQQVRQLAQVANFDERYPITLEQVKADIAYGRQLGVRSTPTFFINGVKIEGALPAALFDQAIAYELKRVVSQ